jgi:hypothetical protein
VRDYFGVDAVFSDSSAYKVAVLSSEVQHQNGIVFGLHFAVAHG